MNSTFLSSVLFTDGFMDRSNNDTFSPPDIPVYAAEYKDGWDSADAAFQPIVNEDEFFQTQNLELRNSGR